MPPRLKSLFTNVVASTSTKCSYALRQLQFERESDLTTSTTTWRALWRRGRGKECLERDLEQRRFQIRSSANNIITTPLPPRPSTETLTLRIPSRYSTELSPPPLIERGTTVSYKLMSMGHCVGHQIIDSSLHHRDTDERHQGRSMNS